MLRFKLANVIGTELCSNEPPERGCMPPFLQSLLVANTAWVHEELGTDDTPFWPKLHVSVHQKQVLC
jgi:hypothetical protein